MKAIILVVMIVIIYVVHSKMKDNKLTVNEDIEGLEKALFHQKDESVKSKKDAKKESEVRASDVDDEDIEKDIPTVENIEEVVENSGVKLSTVGMEEEAKNLSKKVEHLPSEADKILLEYRVCYKDKSQKTINGKISKKELENSYIIGRSEEHCNLVVKEELPSNATRCNIGTIHIKLTYREIGEEKVFKVEKIKRTSSESGDYLYVRSNDQEKYRKVQEEQFVEKLQIRMSIIYGEIVLILGVPGSLDSILNRPASTIINKKQKESSLEKENKIKWKMPNQDPWKKK